MTKLTDFLGNQSQYNMGTAGGLWFPYSWEGPGCVPCTLRGNTASLPDANGNALSTTDALNNTTTYTYDSNNNMTSASQQLNSNTTATTSYTYNSFGEVLTATDPLGHTTTNPYALGGGTGRLYMHAVSRNAAFPSPLIYSRTPPEWILPCRGDLVL
jgi:YD repeat-containing protein